MRETIFSYLDVYSECPSSHSTIRPTVHLTQVIKAPDPGSGAPPRAVSDIPVVKCTYSFVSNIYRDINSKNVPNSEDPLVFGPPDPLLFV